MVRWPYTRLSKAQKQSKADSSRTAARTRGGAGGNAREQKAVDDHDSEHSCAETLYEYSCVPDDEDMVESSNVHSPDADSAQQPEVKVQQESGANGTLTEQSHDPPVETAQCCSTSSTSPSACRQTATTICQDAESTDPRSRCSWEDLREDDDVACEASDFAWLLNVWQ